MAFGNPRPTVPPRTQEDCREPRKNGTGADMPGTGRARRPRPCLRPASSPNDGEMSPVGGRGGPHQIAAHLLSAQRLQPVRGCAQAAHPHHTVPPRRRPRVVCPQVAASGARRTPLLCRQVDTNNLRHSQPHSRAETGRRQTLPGRSFQRSPMGSASPHGSGRPAVRTVMNDHASTHSIHARRTDAGPLAHAGAPPLAACLNKLGQASTVDEAELINKALAGADRPMDQSAALRHLARRASAQHRFPRLPGLDNDPRHDALRVTDTAPARMPPLPSHRAGTGMKPGRVTRITR